MIMFGSADGTVLSCKGSVVVCGCIFVLGIRSGESRKNIFGGGGEFIFDWIFDTAVSILLVDFVDVNVGISGWVS